MADLMPDRVAYILDNKDKIEADKRKREESWDLSEDSEVD